MSSVRRLPRAFAILLAAVALPGAAFAQSADGLPKGYTSDDLPVLPASQAASAPSVGTELVNDTVVVSDEYADTDPSAISDFREPLASYGTWVEDSTYGTVWVPSAVVVGADFAPYQTAGHWALTDDGDWLWVSDYEWGHIPFHYGRWVWIGGRGWSWIPGRVYAPAWVNWRVSDYGYIGWAPMPPTYYWYGGSAVSLWVVPPAPYVFCSTGYVFHRHVHTYVVRDTHIIRRIGAHSKTYKPADASVGGSAQAKAPGGPGGQAAMAPGGQQSARRYPKGPSLAEARVPESVAPKARVSHDAKAVAFSTRSSTARAKTMPPQSRGLQASQQGRGAAGGGVDVPSRGRPGISARGQAEAPERRQVDASARQERDHGPVIRTPTSQPRYDSAPASAAPSRQVTRSAPSQRSFQHSAPSAPSHASPAPVRRQSQSSTQAPTRSATSAAPVSRPSSVQAAPSRSVTRSAPSVSPSRSSSSSSSSRSSSAPSRSSGGSPSRRK